MKKKRPTPPKQKSVADFFNAPSGPSGAAKKAPEKRKISQSMKPASPPKAKPKPAPRRVVNDDDDDDDDDIEFDDIPKPPARAPRGARAAAAKPAYIEIGSDEDDGAGDDSLFVDDD